MGRPRKMKKDILEEFHEETLKEQALDARDEDLPEAEFESELELGDEHRRTSLDGSFMHNDDALFETEEF